MLKVKFAADCSECSHCGDLWCDECNAHYDECECIGPTEEGFDFVEEEDGLYAIPEAKPYKLTFCDGQELSMDEEGQFYHNGREVDEYYVPSLLGDWLKENP